MRSGVHVLGVALVAVLCAAAPSADGGSPVTVTQHAKAFHVVARFAVPQTAAVVHEVLTDYDRIPEFAPGVKVSKVVERGADAVLVSQDAVAKFLMFSRRIHLELQVKDAIDTISFQDRSGESFERYEGEWRIDPESGEAGTIVSYDLVATPKFDVPGALLKHLFERDSATMVRRLQQAFAARAVARTPASDTLAP
jgi:ribosome-associated toxin RatA of RatAB toxin-antitoxin module